MKIKKNVNNCKNLQTMKTLFEKCSLSDSNNNESSQFTNFIKNKALSRKKIRW